MSPATEAQMNKLKEQFSIFTEEQLQVLRISLYKYVVDCENDGRTDTDAYRDAVPMFEYLDYKFNVEGER